MHPAHAQPIGARGGGGNQQRLCGIIVGLYGARFQLGDDVRKAGHFVRVRRGQPIGDLRQLFGRGEVLAKGGGHIGGIGGGGSEACGDVRRGALQQGRIARQTLRLFGKSVTDAGGPADVGAAIHVIADPAGKTQRHRLQFAPLGGPAFTRGGKQRTIDRIARRLAPRDRGQGGVMFAVQRDRVARMAGGAHRRCGEIACAGGRRNGLALRLRQQESRVRGEDNMRGGARPTFGEMGESAGIHALDHRQISRHRQRPRQPVQPPRTVQQPLALHLRDHRLKGIEGEIAALNPPREFEAQLEHRVELRRFTGVRVQFLQAGIKGGNLAHAGQLRVCGGQDRPPSPTLS